MSGDTNSSGSSRRGGGSVSDFLNKFPTSRSLSSMSAESISVKQPTTTTPQNLFKDSADNIARKLENAASSADSIAKKFEHAATIPSFDLNRKWDEISDKLGDVAEQYVLSFVVGAMVGAAVTAGIIMGGMVAASYTNFKPTKWLNQLLFKNKSTSDDDDSIQSFNFDESCRITVLLNNSRRSRLLMVEIRPKEEECCSRDDDDDNIHTTNVENDFNAQYRNCLKSLKHLKSINKDRFSVRQINVSLIPTGEFDINKHSRLIRKAMVELFDIDDNRISISYIPRFELVNQRIGLNVMLVEEEE